jgi:hypothetical protein
MAANIEEAAHWIREADFILIAGGAGGYAHDNYFRYH